jgi:hypothetical protein
MLTVLPELAATIAAFAQTQHGNMLNKARMMAEVKPDLHAGHVQATTYTSPCGKTRSAGPLCRPQGLGDADPGRQGAGDRAHAKKKDASSFLKCCATGGAGVKV